MLDQTQETSCWKTPQLITCTEPSSLSANPASFPQHARSVVRTKKKRSVRGSRKDVGEWRPNRSQRLSREVEESEPLLACPFVKHNPLASPGCWEFAAENLARLKEHLLRRHERPYCPICLDQFDNYDARDMHVRERACQQVDGEQRGDWLEPDVVQKIRQRTKKGETPMEGWQRMYCIIFPDAKTVPPPYVEDIGQSYMERARKSVVNEFIRYVHSTLDNLSTDTSPNESSMIKSACVSHLRMVADEFVRKENTEEVMLTSTETYNIQGGSQTMIQPDLSSLVDNCDYNWTAPYLVDIAGIGSWNLESIWPSYLIDGNSWETPIKLT
ncbi:hypothetical protein B0T12DRAFT_481294 [Alternaria alternata]|nr:hypothetical protein B0T12DRAFT_481294 [Alternaria alternata]OWY42623.1 hypothetical protein AALT_g139 [Alternaria alternata]